jgi:hypothetical protein
MGPGAGEKVIIIKKQYARISASLLNVVVR